jgi:hypothetical protein
MFWALCMCSAGFSIALAHTLMHVCARGQLVHWGVKDRLLVATGSWTGISCVTGGTGAVLLRAFRQDGLSAVLLGASCITTIDAPPRLRRVVVEDMCAHAIIQPLLPWQLCMCAMAPPGSTVICMGGSGGIQASLKVLFVTRVRMRPCSACSPVTAYGLCTTEQGLLSVHLVHLASACCQQAGLGTVHTAGNTVAHDLCSMVFC